MVSADFSPTTILANGAEATTRTITMLSINASARTIFGVALATTEWPEGLEFLPLTDWSTALRALDLPDVETTTLLAATMGQPFS